MHISYILLISYFFQLSYSFLRVPHRPFTILRPCCAKSRAKALCVCSNCLCSFISSIATIPQRIMASITTPSSTALATDVIAVIGPNGMYSTDFYVKFSTSLYKPSSLEGLGLDQPHSDSGNNHVNNDNTDTTKDRAGSDDMAPSNERKGNDSEERLQLLKLGPEWVDIYCNDILCKDVSAVIGIKGLLFFVEDKKLSLVPSGEIPSGPLDVFRRHHGPSATVIYKD